MKKVIIIGAGPAGLTAGYDLLSKSSEYEVTIVEESSVVGGLCARHENEENVLDAGGHMFISNNAAVKRFWNSILPSQGVPSKDDLILDRYCKISNGGPDPSEIEDVLLSRERITRFYKDTKFYETPIRFNKENVKNIGFATSIKSGFSQIGGNVFKHKENSLEDYYIKRIGKQLYSMFLEEYLEKVWGKKPSQMGNEWGAISEKNTIAPCVTMEKNVKDYEKANATSAARYYYPKYGAYQMWETAADRFIEMGGSIHKNCKVTSITTNQNRITSVKCSADGDEFVVRCDYLISSMPIRDLIMGMDNVDYNVKLVAETLSYRGLVSVLVELTDMVWKNDSDEYKTLDNIIPDSFIYINNLNVKVSRIQVYNNFSPYMVRNNDHYYLGLNYYCNEGDYYWSMNNRDWQKTVESDLMKLGIIRTENSIVGFNKVKYSKAFPAYYEGIENLELIKNFLNRFDNLYCVGRNGQHRFSNIDESMKTSFEAVKNILGYVRTKDNIWNVNDKEDDADDKSYNSALLSGEGEYRGNARPIQKQINSENKEEAEYVPPRRMRRPMMTPIKKAVPNAEPVFLDNSVVIAARPERTIPISEEENVPVAEVNNEIDNDTQSKVLKTPGYSPTAEYVSKNVASVKVPRPGMPVPSVRTAPKAPVAENIPEPVPVYEAAEPAVESVAAPAVEAVAEPVAEATVIAPSVETAAAVLAETAVETVTEPVYEEPVYVSEPVSEPAYEETVPVEEPVSEEPVYEAEPVAEPVPEEPVYEAAPAEEPIFEEPVYEAEPVAEPVYEEAPVAEEPVETEEPVAEEPDYASMSQDDLFAAEEEKKNAETVQETIALSVDYEAVSKADANRVEKVMEDSISQKEANEIISPKTAFSRKSLGSIGNEERYKAEEKTHVEAKPFAFATVSSFKGLDKDSPDYVSVENVITKEKIHENSDDDSPVSFSKATTFNEGIDERIANPHEKLIDSSAEEGAEVIQFVKASKFKEEAPAKTYSDRSEFVHEQEDEFSPEKLDKESNIKNVFKSAFKKIADSVPFVSKEPEPEGEAAVQETEAPKKTVFRVSEDPVFESIEEPRVPKPTAPAGESSEKTIFKIVEDPVSEEVNTESATVEEPVFEEVKEESAAVEEPVFETVENEPEELTAEAIEEPVFEEVKEEYAAAEEPVYETSEEPEYETSEETVLEEAEESVSEEITEESAAVEEPVYETVEEPEYVTAKETVLEETEETVSEEITEEYAAAEEPSFESYEEPAAKEEIPANEEAEESQSMKIANSYDYIYTQAPVEEESVTAETEEAVEENTASEAEIYEEYAEPETAYAQEEKYEEYSVEEPVYETYEQADEVIAEAEPEKETPSQTSDVYDDYDELERGYDEFVKAETPVSQAVEETPVSESVQEEDDSLSSIDEQAASRAIVKGGSNRYHDFSSIQKSEESERISRSGSVSNDLYGDNFAVSSIGKKGVMDHMLDDLDGGKEYESTRRPAGGIIKSESPYFNHETKENEKRTESGSFKIIKESGTHFDFSSREQTLINLKNNISYHHDGDDASQRQEEINRTVSEETSRIVPEETKGIVYEETKRIAPEENNRIVREERPVLKQEPERRSQTLDIPILSKVVSVSTPEPVEDVSSNETEKPVERKIQSINPSPEKTTPVVKQDYLKKEIDTSIVFKNARVIKTTKITRGLDEVPEVKKKEEKRDKIFSDKEKVIAVIRNGEVIPVEEDKPKAKKPRKSTKKKKAESEEDMVQPPISVMLDAKEAAEMTEPLESPAKRKRGVTL